LSFLNALRARWLGQKLYVIADNFSPHEHPDGRAIVGALTGRQRPENELTELNSRSIRLDRPLLSRICGLRSGNGRDRSRALPAQVCSGS